MNNFAPLGASTASVTATTSSQALALTHSISGDVRLYNSGSVTVFVEFGPSTATASTSTSMPIAAGTVEAFSLGPAATHMACITASSTSTIYATVGEGL